MNVNVLSAACSSAHPVWFPQERAQPPSADLHSCASGQARNASSRGADGRAATLQLGAAVGWQCRQFDVFVHHLLLSFCASFCLPPPPYIHTHTHTHTRTHHCVFAVCLYHCIFQSFIFTSFMLVSIPIISFFLKKTLVLSCAKLVVVIFECISVYCVNGRHTFGRG